MPGKSYGQRSLVGYIQLYGASRVRQNLATIQQQLGNMQPPGEKKKKKKKKPPSLFFFVMSVSFKEAKGLKLPIYKDESLLP